MSEIKVFLSNEVKEQQHRQSVKRIIDGFKAYKSTGDPGQMFGRDAEMIRPKEARENEVFHAHLLDQARFKLERLHLRDQYNRKSDAFVLYTRGYTMRNHYLILSIIFDDAHSKTENIDLMLGYSRIAEHFRERF